MRRPLAGPSFRALTLTVDAAIVRGKRAAGGKLILNAEVGHLVYFFINFPPRAIRARRDASPFLTRAFLASPLWRVPTEVGESADYLLHFLREESGKSCPRSRSAGPDTRGAYERGYPED
ncbi:hypothetical protein KM043_006895 [Ampulex compressa]|nr:hypothetical protein KM043_006895 [Ampulex compressa]